MSNKKSFTLVDHALTTEIMLSEFQQFTRGSKGLSKIELRPINLHERELYFCISLYCLHFFIFLILRF